MLSKPITAISWEVPLSFINEGRLDRDQITRKELIEVIQQTSLFCIESIVNTYSLGSEVRDAMYDRVAGFEAMLVTGGEAEKESSTQESLPIGAAIGDVALSSSVKVEPLKEDKEAIYLSLNGITEEVETLLYSLDCVVPVFKENKGMHTETDTILFELQHSGDNLVNTAVALAYARRLLKYGLLRSEDLKSKKQKMIGCEDWLKYCKDVSDRKNDFSKDEAKLLQGVYENEDMAIKNLRYSVWTNLFYTIVGVNPEHDPFFYMHYATSLESSSKYSITFNYQGRACKISEENVQELLTSIYAPSRKNTFR